MKRCRLHLDTKTRVSSISGDFSSVDAESFAPGQFVADLLSDLGFSDEAVGEFLEEIEEPTGRWRETKSFDWTWGRAYLKSGDTFLELGDSQLRPPIKALIVDDNPVSCDVAAIVLRRNGYDAESFTSALASLERAAECPFDLALVDLRMSEMNGIELGRRLRKLSDGNDLPSTRIYLLTATADEEIAVKCEDAGLDGCLLKPIGRSVLEMLSSDEAAIRQCGAGDGFAVLDSEFWQEDLELQKKLYSQALEDLKSTLHEIAELVEARDLERLKKSVHYLKGTLDVIGAIRFAEICSLTLAQLRGEDLDGAIETIKSYDSEFQELSSKLSENR